MSRAIYWSSDDSVITRSLNSSWNPLPPHLITITINEHWAWKSCQKSSYFMLWLARCVEVWQVGESFFFFFFVILNNFVFFWVNDFDTTHVFLVDCITVCAPLTTVFHSSHRHYKAWPFHQDAVECTLALTSWACERWASEFIPLWNMYETSTPFP